MMFIACNTCDQIIAQRNEGIHALCAAAEAHSNYSGHVCTATHDVDGDAVKPAPFVDISHEDGIRFPITVRVF